MSALAPIKQFDPITALENHVSTVQALHLTSTYLFKTVAPIPTKELFPIVHPWSIAMWPIVTPFPICILTPGSVWSTAPSCTFVLSPISIKSLSPRITALNQTLLDDPMFTFPTTTAFGATHTLGAIKGFKIGLLSMEKVEKKRRANMLMTCQQTCTMQTVPAPDSRTFSVGARWGRLNGTSQTIIF